MMRYPNPLLALIRERQALAIRLYAKRVRKLKNEPALRARLVQLDLAIVNSLPKIF